MLNLSESAVSNEKQEGQKIARFFIDQEFKSEKGPTIFVGASDIGPIRAILALIKFFPDIKALYYLTTGEATSEIKQQRKLPEAIMDYRKLAINKIPNILFTAGEVHPEIANVLTDNFEKSGATVVWLEDAPGSLRNRIGQPDLVFCFNAQSATEFERIRPDISRKKIHTLGLNPDFLRLSIENPQAKGTETRKRLGIQESTLVVTFIGSKSTDIPDDPQILAELSHTLKQIKTDTTQDIILIRRDHPGEPNPEVYDDSLSFYPEKTISMPKGSELFKQNSTAEICCASNLLIGVSSTVFDEAAFRGALAGKAGEQGTLVVLRHEKSYSLPVVDSGSALVAYSSTELKQKIIDALYNLNVQKKLHDAQKSYCDVEGMEQKIKNAINLILRTLKNQ